MWRRGRHSASQNKVVAFISCLGVITNGAVERRAHRQLSIFWPRPGDYARHAHQLSLVCLLFCYHTIVSWVSIWQIGMALIHSRCGCPPGMESVHKVICSKVLAARLDPNLGALRRLDTCQVGNLVFAFCTCYLGNTSRHGGQWHPAVSKCLERCGMLGTCHLSVLKDDTFL